MISDEICDTAREEGEIDETKRIGGLLLNKLDNDNDMHFGDGVGRQVFKAKASVRPRTVRKLSTLGRAVRKQLLRLKSIGVSKPLGRTWRKT